MPASGVIICCLLPTKCLLLALPRIANLHLYNDPSQVLCLTFVQFSNVPGITELYLYNERLKWSPIRVVLKPLLLATGQVC